MKDTYKTQADERADKAQQERLLAALNGSAKALRLDECRAWHIKGSRGHIYTWGDGHAWVLFVSCADRPRKWTWAKKRLSFCEITQDGDDEGCLRLGQLPTAQQAIEIRAALGINETKPPPVAGFRSQQNRHYSE